MVLKTQDLAIILNDGGRVNKRICKSPPFLSIFHFLSEESSPRHIHFGNKQGGGTHFEKKPEVPSPLQDPIHHLLQVSGEGHLFYRGRDLPLFDEKALGPNGKVAGDGIGRVYADQL